MKTVLMTILLCLGFLQAEQSSAPAKPKKYRYEMSVCAVFKNEEKYLKEWIEYHRMVGVDHFYLYNNNSSDAFRRVLQPYLRSGIVTLMNWPDNWKNLTEENAFLWTLGTQIPAYENAVSVRACTETKWLTFLDIDEYLVPSKENTLLAVLGNYKNGVAVILSSDYFDASKRSTLPLRKLLIETVERTKPPKQDLKKMVFKTIFRPDLCAGFSWPPYQKRFKEYQFPVPLEKDEIRINHYLNRQDLFFGANKKLSVDQQSFSSDQINELVEDGYEIEDKNCTISRFVPELLKRMGF